MWFVLLLMQLWILNGDHDFHVSRTKMHFNDQSKQIEITMYVFVDDLELAIAEDGHLEKLYIGTQFENPHTDSVLAVYLSQHFQLSQEEDIHIDFLGKEVSEDFLALWIYLESDPIQRNLPITAFNDLFQKIYSDQQNILKYNTPQYSEHVLFHSGLVEYTFAK